MRMHPVLEAFDAEGEALRGIVQDLTPRDLAILTNCPPWNLAELVVHIAGSVRTGAFTSSAAGAEPREAADYYRRPERDTDEYRDHNVRVAQQHAHEVLARMTVAECFESAFQNTKSIMASDDLDRIVEIDHVGPMRLSDWLTTRVIAVAAHGLDIAITLQVQAWTTPQSLAVMRPIFLSLLGRAQPIDWSDQRLLEVATGRAGLSDRDRADLGAAATRFPLLS